MAAVTGCVLDDCPEKVCPGVEIMAADRRVTLCKCSPCKCERCVARKSVAEGQAGENGDESERQGDEQQEQAS